VPRSTVFRCTYSFKQLLGALEAGALGVDSTHSTTCPVCVGHVSAALCERAHELTPRKKLRFITMEGVQSRLNSLSSRSAHAAIFPPQRATTRNPGAACGRTHATLARREHRTAPAGTKEGGLHLSHSSGGSRTAGGEVGSQGQARRERAKHAPLAHAWAPYSMDTQKIHLHPPPPPLWQDGDRRQTSPRSKC
jgi:hypothetical protein